MCNMHTNELPGRLLQRGRLLRRTLLRGAPPERTLLQEGLLRKRLL
jgi:hypothetical protein